MLLPKFFTVFLPLTCRVIYGVLLLAASLKENMLVRNAPTSHIYIYIYIIPNRFSFLLLIVPTCFILSSWPSIWISYVLAVHTSIYFQTLYIQMIKITLNSKIKILKFLTSVYTISNYSKLALI